MRFIWSILLLFAWGLWLGGLVAVFFVVTLLFAADKTLAVQVGPRVFPPFEKFELILGAVALIACFFLRASTKSGVWTLLVALLVAAVLPAIASPLLVTPRLMQLWSQNLSYNAEFKTLHGYSMMLYSTTTIVLALAGLVLPRGLMRIVAKDTP
ncbi:MAG: hypothetical protein ABSH20_11320 [Tepidisphaeraceae bacterium]|jgi:hypothetical protein